MRNGRITLLLLFGFLTLLFNACSKKQVLVDQTDLFPELKDTSEAIDSSALVYVDKVILLKDYFSFVDTLCAQWSRKNQCLLTDYHLVHTNSWILNRLEHTDYYFLKEKGITRKKLLTIPIFRPGDKILIPDSTQRKKIDADLSNTQIDVNLPEYKLEIKQYDQPIRSMSIRIGQLRKRYLAMANNTVNLKTRAGHGYIGRVNRKPIFINPANNKVYKGTRRDDGVYTDLPPIPWLEPIIDGMQYGQLIHPTTNLRTLGKKSSNGCIGVRESDGWFIYYHAPLGSKVTIRYDRRIVDSQGDTILLPDVYLEE